MQPCSLEALELSNPGSPPPWNLGVLAVSLGVMGFWSFENLEPLRIVELWSTTKYTNEAFWRWSPGIWEPDELGTGVTPAVLKPWSFGTLRPCNPAFWSNRIPGIKIRGWLAQVLDECSSGLPKHSIGIGLELQLFIRLIFDWLPKYSIDIRLARPNVQSVFLDSWRFELPAWSLKGLKSWRLGPL